MPTNVEGVTTQKTIKFKTSSPVKTSDLFTLLPSNHQAYRIFLMVFEK